MQVILLENVNRLGKIGEVVKVRDGFARNFLIPRKKAVRATKENLVYFENRRSEIEAQNQQRKFEAQGICDAINGTSVTLVRQAGEDGRLYGSVTAKDIAQALSDKTGHSVSYTVVVLNNKFKEIGIYPITLQLHAEVAAIINLNVARNEEEAKVAEIKAAKTKDAEEAAAKKKEPKVKASSEEEAEGEDLAVKKNASKKTKEEKVDVASEEDTPAPKKAAKKAKASSEDKPAKKSAAKKKSAKEE